jgi:hypothetical protein
MALAGLDLHRCHGELIEEGREVEEEGEEQGGVHWPWKRKKGGDMVELHHEGGSIRLFVVLYFLPMMPSWGRREWRSCPEVTALKLWERGKIEGVCAVRTNGGVSLL